MTAAPATGPLVFLAETDPRPGRGLDVANVAARAPEPVRLRMLLSYWYFKDIDLRALLERHFTQPWPEIFADSGAYSAHTQGAQINVGAYADWLHRYRDLFATYANLDDLCDWRRTARHQADLEARGLAPLPVFHAGEPLGVLEDLVAGYPYVGLGGLVGKAARSATRPFLVRAFRLAQGRAVYHGFGMTTWRHLRDFAWYSVDSASWGSGYRYGQVPLFDDQTGRWHEVRLGRAAPTRPHAQIVRRYGFEPLDFSDRERNNRATIAALSAVSFMRAETWLRRRHGPVPIPGRPAPPGVRVVLADTDTSTGARPNLAHADAAIKAFLTDANPVRLAHGDAGLKTYLADGCTNRLRDAQAGLRTYLGASPKQAAAEGVNDMTALAEAGLKVFLGDARPSAPDKSGAAAVLRA